MSRSPQTPRASFLYLLGTGLQALSVLLVIPIARPLLGPHEWGLVALALSLVQLGTVVLTAGLPLAITRFYFDPEHGPRQARAVATLMGVAGMAVTGLSAVAFVVLRDRSWSALLLAGCILGCQAAVVGAQAVLRARRRPVAFVVLALLSSSVPHVGGVVGASYGDPSATTYLLGYLAVVGGAVLLATWLVRPARPDLPVIRDALGLGLPVLPHSLALMALLQAPVTLAAILGSPSQAGTYFVAQVVAVGCVQVLGALNNVWVPDVIEAGWEERMQRFEMVAKNAHRVAVALALTATAAAPFAMAVLAPDQPGLAGPASVLGLVCVPYAGYLMATTALFAEGRTRSMAVVTPLVATVGILVMAVAAASGSAVALAATLVASYCLLSIAYWKVLARLDDRTPTYPVGPLVLVGVAAAGGSVLVVDGMVGLVVRSAVIMGAAAWWWAATPRKVSTAG